MIVLDTSYILEGPDLPPGHQFIITEGVVEELKRHKGFDTIESLIDAKKVDITSSKESFLEDVKKEAKNLGLDKALSDTDVNVIALSLEKGLELWSFDKNLTRVALALGLNTRPKLDNLDKSMKLKPRCTGCGTWLNVNQISDDGKVPGKRIVGSCLICGSAVKLKRSK